MNPISIIPDSISADEIISENNLKKTSVGGMTFYQNFYMNLLVINLAQTGHIIRFLSYFPVGTEIIFIKPKRARFGISDEIFDNIKSKIIGHKISYTIY